MAERVRFELTVPSSGTPAFEAGAFNRSTTSPYGATLRRRGYYPRLGVDTFPALGDPLFPKEPAQLVGRFFFQHARRHLEAVIGLPRLQHVERAPVGTALGIARGIHDTFQPRRDDRTRAHDARFFGNVERCFVQTPRPESSRSFTNQQHLGVRRWIGPRFFL